MMIDYSELVAFSVDVRRAEMLAAQNNLLVANQYGKGLHLAVRMRASGRPGPRIITGQYFNSIKLDLKSSGDSAIAEVYTTEKRGYRLEYGFHGVDSSGRLSNSRPYPHFVPALATVVPQWENSLANTMRDSIIGRRSLM